MSARLLGRRLRRPAGGASREGASWTFIFVAVLISTVAFAWFFSVGDAGQISGFRLLNHIAHNSVRVAGRYQILFSFAAALAAALLIGPGRLIHRPFVLAGLAVVPGLVCVDLVVFLSTANLSSPVKVTRAKVDAIANMRVLRIGRERTEAQSYMYRSMLRGLAMLNCYDPIARETRLTREFVARPEFSDAAGRPLDGLVLPLVDPTVGAPPPSCREQSYFNQNSVVLDRTCPPGTCINVNGLNPRATRDFVLNRINNKYCLSALRD